MFFCGRQPWQGIRTASPGFSTASVLTTGVQLVAAGYDEPQAKIFQDELIDRVSALPGVQSAAFARVTPLGNATYSSTPIAVDGYQPPLEEQPSIEYNQVSPGYFATLGIPVLSGREFTRADDENAPLVAIVNRTMTTLYWGGQDPIGRRLQVKGRWARVVGIAADSKYESMRETPTLFFYVPLRQDFVRAPRALYPHQSTHAGDAGRARSRGTCSGFQPRAVRDDHPPGTSQPLDLASTRRRHPGIALGRLGASSR
jgi:hypothetical protein